MTPLGAQLDHVVGLAVDPGGERGAQRDVRRERRCRLFGQTQMVVSGQCEAGHRLAGGVVSTSKARAAEAALCVAAVERGPTDVIAVSEC